MAFGALGSGMVVEKVGRKLSERRLLPGTDGLRNVGLLAKRPEPSWRNARLRKEGLVGRATCAGQSIGTRLVAGVD